MADWIAPLMFALIFWWVSTGAILWLVGLPRRMHGRVAWAASGLAVLAGVGVIALRQETGVAAAYGGFALGVAIWGWQEMLFLLGFVTGPRRTHCPAGLSGMARFRAAAATVMHHELAIAATALALAAFSLGAANTVALSTFVLLWGMRLASKAVVFTGAPNLAHGFLPAHLAYLKGYFGTGRPGLTFALVLGAVLGVAVMLGVQAAALAPGSFAATAMWLMTTLAALAVFEHLALVLPLPDAALWSWAVRHPPIQTTKEGTP